MIQITPRVVSSEEHCAIFARRLSDAQENVETVQELFEFVYNNYDILSFMETNYRGWMDGYSSNFKFRYIRFHGTYQSESSNSHSAPKNKPQNFCRTPGTPIGYPAFYGRLQYQVLVPDYARQRSSLGFRCFEGTGIATGSGGGVSLGKEAGFDIVDYVFDARIWLDDWVGIAKHQSMIDYFDRCIVAKLTGSHSNPSYEVKAEVGEKYERK